MSRVKRYERNVTGRDFVVGDIHGHFTKLQSQLTDIGFSPENGDRLFSVGDLVDRGPESHLFEEWIAKPWFHAIQGNHEDMAIMWSELSHQMDEYWYVSNGGKWNSRNTKEEQIRIANELSRLPYAIEIETEYGIVGLVHADVPYSDWGRFVFGLEEKNIIDSDLDSLRTRCLWNRDRINSMNTRGVSGVHAVVVGHTPVNAVVQLGNVYHIDTAGWTTSGKFTILDISTL